MMMRYRSQFKLATLIRVQNLSQRPTSGKNGTFGIKFKYKNIKFKNKECDAGHA
jgi:hypothetical protein